MEQNHDTRSTSTRSADYYACLLISDIPLIHAALSGLLSDLKLRGCYEHTSTWRGARLAMLNQAFDLIIVCYRGNFSRELAALDRAFRNNTWLAMPLSGNSGLVGLARDRRNIQLLSFSTSVEQLRDAVTHCLVRGVANFRPVAASNETEVAILSTQERDVLELLSNGLSTKQIADKLHYAPGTVRNCLSKTYRKLGVTDRTSAALVFSRLYQQDTSVS